MNQQHKIQYTPINNPHNRLHPPSIADLFQGFPYSMYPPYWPFQYPSASDQL